MDGPHGIGMMGTLFESDGDAHSVVPVKIGLDNGDRAEILEGLEEGAEVLVTRPVDDSKNGGRPRVRF